MSSPWYLLIILNYWYPFHTNDRCCLSMVWCCISLIEIHVQSIISAYHIWWLLSFQHWLYSLWYLFIILSWCQGMAWCCLSYPTGAKTFTLWTIILYCWISSISCVYIIAYPYDIETIYQWCNESKIYSKDYNSTFYFSVVLFLVLLMFIVLLIFVWNKCETTK